MIHHDEALTQVTPLQGPETNVTSRWEKELGRCIGNASVGEDYALYIAIQKSGEHNKLHKLKSSNGNRRFYYTPGQSGTSPTVVGGRVYIASGKDVGEDATLYSLDASDGTLMATSAFDIGKIKASAVVEHVNGKNRIYVHSGTAVLGFEDALSSQPGQSLSCKWRSSKKYNTLSGNASKSIGGLLYLPFTKVGDLQLRAYAGAFDPDNGWGSGSACLTGLSDLPANDPCDCAGTPVWKISMGSGVDDICTRSLGVNESSGKPQVYFGTNTTFFAFE